MSVMSATVGRPAPVATEAMLCASSRALGSVGMNAPLPHLTSIARPSSPAASFFDRIDAVISPMLSTVAVTSRMPYSRLSAGARSAV
ncbi:unannotated protein [freshwater metagenome]|uniref:Unannotated protein n=1 Tax=freshwater metagenome TaxID=449393 RepID=A0A6J7C8P9_9ZZZZ